MAECKMAGATVPSMEPEPSRAVERSKECAVIFRSLLLARSELFIRAQAEAFQRFSAIYVGCRLDAAVRLPPERTLVLNCRGGTGRARELCFKLFSTAPGLLAEIRRLAPVLIHAHFGPDAALVLPLTRRLGVPLVTTFHGFDATMDDWHARRSFFLHRKYLRRRSQLQRDGALFLAVSEFIRQHLLRQGYPEERTIVHHIGVDLVEFRPPAAARRPVVLFVGRLVPEKGADHLLRAMVDVERVCPDAELVVLGDGPLRPSLEQTARATLRRAQFLGEVTREDVIAWMGTSRVLCVPSVTLPTGQAEGFGLVFAEAQAMQLPVVSFAVGGIPEAVADGESGFLASEGDDRALAQHLVRVLQDAALADRLGAAGRLRAQALFDLHRQTRVLEALYERVIG